MISAAGIYQGLTFGTADRGFFNSSLAMLLYKVGIPSLLCPNLEQGKLLGPYRSEFGVWFDKVPKRQHDWNQ